MGLMHQSGGTRLGDTLLEEMPHASHDQPALVPGGGEAAITVSAGW